MAKKKAKIDSNMEIMVELLEENEISSEMGEAFASYMLNPTVVWAKFILTDDRRNANGQRIPRTEFSNLIKSGIHMPVKMSIGEISEGHDNSKPLGVITHLKETELPDGASALVALAALWGEERPADVQYIKERFDAGQPVNVSWEILYSDSKFNQESASIDLQDTVLRAATVVGMPAYEGRTQFLSVAAKKWSKAFIEELPDTSFTFVDEEGNRFLPIADKDGVVDRIKLIDAVASVGDLKIEEDAIESKKQFLNELIKKFESGESVVSISESSVTNLEIVEDVTLKTIEELQAEVDRLTVELEGVKTSVASKDEEITRLTNLNTQYETELTPLKEFKASIDEENAKKEKLAEVKNKFVEAGIEKGDEFYVENAEKLVKLDEDSLNFMIQELKAFAESSTTASASKKTKIPALGGESEAPSKEELIEYLRTRNAKK